MITLKIKYSTCFENLKTISEYQRQYNNLLHLFYNRIREGVSETICKHLEYQNLDLMKSWFRQSCVKEASQLYKTSKDTPILFGGKYLFNQRLRKNISKEDFKEKRLLPLTSAGEGRCNGNRLFRMSEACDYVIFKPESNLRIKLDLVGVGKRVSILKKVFKHQQLKDTPITYKLDKKFIYITFDEIILQEESVNPVNNRILAIDMNPNYIGYSILDWKSKGFNIVESGCISLKNINDKDANLKTEKLPSTDSKRVFIHNKRIFETYEISKFLGKQARHFRCEFVAVEDLDMKSTDIGRGKSQNKLINNNWNRNKLVNNLQKRCTILGIKFQKVVPSYSSIIGNLTYRELKLPDPVLSSIEISRRCYEFNLQYILKVKEQTKNIVFPILTDSLRDKIKHSLEEVKCLIEFDSWKDLFNSLKKSKVKYRFPFSLEQLGVFESKNLRFVNQFM